MARRKKSSVDGAGILVILLVIFAGLLACLVPIWWLWSESSLRSGPSRPADLPDPDELARGRRLHDRLDEHAEAVAAARQHLHAVNASHDQRLAAIRAAAEAMGCRERSDGLYDERRAAAVTINRRLVRAQKERDEEVGDARRELARVEYERDRGIEALRDILDGPTERMEEWFESHRDMLRDAYTARGAVVGLLLAGGLLAFMREASDDPSGESLVAAIVLIAAPAGLLVAVGAWIGRMVCNPVPPHALGRDAVLAAILAAPAEGAARHPRIAGEA